jgi:hypothetical protein
MMRKIIVGMLIVGIWGCHTQRKASGGIRLRVDSLYVSNGVLWFGMEAKNSSAYDYRATSMRFTIRDRHPLKRKARQELALPMVAGGAPTLLPADSTVHFDCGIKPRIPGLQRELWIEWIERTGDRRVRMQVSNSKIMHVKKVADGDEH